MPRRIDHLVLPVRNLEQAARDFVAIGCTLTPRGTHPWGTSNRLVQLNGCFLELLEVSDPAAIPPTDGPASFAQFNRDFLERQEGVSMLVFEGRDPARDVAQYRDAGLAARDVLTFERDAVQPDGSAQRVGFDLVIVDMPGSRNAGFFTCHQHRPDLFWRADYQRHENTAEAISEVVLEADDVSAAAGFLSALSGASAKPGEDAAIVIDTGGTAIRIVPGPGTPRFTGYTLACRDLEAARSALSAAGFAVTDTPSGVAIGPELLYGVQVTFSQL